MSTMREDGKEDWKSDTKIEHIKIGALQRIADACELMAKNYQALIADRDYYQQANKSAIAANEYLKNRIRGLKSAITRLKK